VDQYPPDDRKKGNLWVLRFIKLTYKVDLAMELGPSAVLLLQYVAMGEDRCDFLKPPHYFAKELQTACGTRDDEAFKKVRDRCVEKGWMCFIPGPIRMASIFWVTIPCVYADMMEAKASSGRTGSSPDHHRTMTGSSPDHNRKIAGGSPVETVVLSPLSPLPLPRVCGSTHTPVVDGVKDIQKIQNTERLRKTMRGLGLSVRGDALDEWRDFLRESCGCRKVDEYAWAMRWLVEHGRDEAGIAVKFAPHAAPMAVQCKTNLSKWRREQATKQGDA
jgi:hypothetical protein